jgi:hypothetical protein
LAARSLFRNDRATARQVKLAALAQAFDEVNIEMPRSRA